MLCHHTSETHSSQSTFPTCGFSLVCSTWGTISIFVSCDADVLVRTQMARSYNFCPDWMMEESGKGLRGTVILSDVCTPEQNA